MLPQFVIRIPLYMVFRKKHRETEEILKRITDPYLNFFRRFSFLRLGMLDLSPIAGIIVLVAVLNMLNAISFSGKITAGIILSIVLSALWSAVSFLLTLFIALIAIRLFMELIAPGAYSPLKTTLDALVNPVILRIKNLFAKRKFLPYKTQMAMSGGILLVLLIGGNSVTGITDKITYETPVLINVFG